jgi:hypothetical protein
MATSPFEIIAGPASVYVAPTGSAFPNPDDDPTTDSGAGGQHVDWTFLGETEGGVKVTHNQKVDLLYTDQNTGPRKAIRSEEGLGIEFGLAELALETYAIALNAAAVTAGSATSGTTRRIPLYQHVDVAEFQFLVKGPSPYMDAFMQYEVPVAIQMGEPTLAFVKNDKSVYATKWVALVDPDAVAVEDRFGHLVAQDS